MVYIEFLFIRFLIVTFLLNFSGLSQSDNLQLLLQKMQSTIFTNQVHFLFACASEPACHFEID